MIYSLQDLQMDSRICQRKVNASKNAKSETRNTPMQANKLFHAENAFANFPVNTITCVTYFRSKISVQSVNRTTKSSHKLGKLYLIYLGQYWDLQV